MRVATEIIGLTVVLGLLHEGLRRARNGVVWGVFLAMPIALTPFWIGANDLGLFPWVKLYSVLACACWVTALRFTTLGGRPWAGVALTTLLAVNILEAVAVDLLAGGAGHGLNAVAGLLLVATLPRTANAMRATSTGKFRSLDYRGTSRGWVIAFTLWNGAFVYLNYPELAGHQAAVLGAALAVGLIDPRRWLQARVYILGADLIALSTFRVPLMSWLDTSNWGDAGLKPVAAGIAFAFATVYAVTARTPWRS